MNRLFIKVIEGVITDHPLMEENLLQAYELEELTPEWLEENDLVEFFNKNYAFDHMLEGRDGYKFCDDDTGTVENNYITVPMTQEQKLDAWCRSPAKFFLNETDWTQMADSPLTDEKKAEFAAYRQELRELPQTYADITNPDDIVRPVMPTI